MFASGSPSPAVQFAAAVEVLAAVTQELAGLVGAGALAEVSEAALPELTSVLLAAGEVCAAMGSAAIERTDRCGVLRGQGFLTTSSWLRSTQRWSPRRCSRTVRVARALGGTFAETGDAWLTGAITAEHAEVITLGLTAAGLTQHSEVRQDNQVAAQAVLLRVAAVTNPTVTASALARIKLAADPDGGSKNAMEAAADQSLTFTPVAGGWAVKGWLTGENGAAATTLFAAKRNTDFHTGTATIASTSSNTGDGTSDVARNRIGHQNAVIFGELMHHLLDHGMAGTMGGERPHVELVVTLADLANCTGSADLDAGVFGLIPVDISTAQQLTCDAQVRTVTTSGRFFNPHTGADIDSVIATLIGAPTEIIDYGRGHYTVPSGLRRTLAKRDNGCVFTHCLRPPGMTQAHHVTHWSHGGHTNIDNLALLCSQHHNAVHHQGWTLTPRDGFHPRQPGYWQTHPPASTRASATAAQLAS